MLERNLNNPRNYGMYDDKSVNTFRNSNISYTIPKSERFKGNYKKGATDSFYEVNSVMSKNSTSLGYGERTDFRFLRGKGNPSPDTYNLGSTLNKKSTSIKSRQPDNTILYKSRIPAPGDYNIRLKETTLPTTLKFRHSLFYEDEMKLKSHCISPQAYFPKTHFTSPNRFNNIKFPTQQRNTNEIGKDLKTNPGPGYYNLPSIFDLSRRTKPAIN